MGRELIRTTRVSQPPGAPRLLSFIRTDQEISPGSVGTLAKDPPCDCQDDDGFRLSSIKIHPLPAGQATAAVSYIVGDVPKSVTLDLTTTDRS